MIDYLAALNKVDRFAFGRLHDICVEIENKEYTDDQIIDIFESLPLGFKLEALQWGLDTVVSDGIYVHIKENGAPHVST